jgi:hypothetical protein
MKKWWLAILLVSLLTLGACSSDTAEISDSEDTKTENASKETVDKTKEDSDKESTEKATEETSEDVQEDDDIKATNTFTNKELAITGTAGPLNYNISGIQLKKLEPKTQDVADMFEVEIGDVVNAITIEMTGENTAEEDMSFYLGQATIVTNTKEQLEPDMYLSEHIEGDYLGQVIHTGYNVYILKNSTVDDLKSIELRISAPMNSNFESIGEDIVQTIEVNN